VQWVQGHPQGEEKFFGLYLADKFVSAPRGQECTPRVTFCYRLGESAVFRLGGLEGILYSEYTDY